ncbi:toll-like receptor 3 [Papilio machaon]|uniref:toll-like receptor 3 n=1 Tax=Papilio machaon TaxID=76193 RepID=UPI001E665586|nr:toll-like receptor 3 [Papilio machaon]
MVYKLLKYFAILIFIIPSVFSTNSCTVEDYLDGCRYTILCENYSGTSAIYSCSSEPHIIFKIRGSRSETLTASFFGATNFDSRVREIKAIDNTWTTIESNAFKYYTKSVNVDISCNHIKIIKNDTFKNFGYLNYLNVSNNEIESLFPNSLAPSSSPDSVLVLLDLSNNFLNSLDYGVLNNFPYLITLYLQNNKIQNISDDSFTSLKNLKQLYMHHNEIEILNMMLINLKSLKELDLSYNKLKKISGYEVNRLIALEKLNMSYNNLEIIESNCFNQAPNLNILDLSHNRIVSIIDQKMFESNIHLQYFDVSYNQIIKIEENSFKNCNLTYFNFDNNFLSGNITNSTFIGLSSITQLNLNHQNVTNLNANAFSSLTKLLSLNISSNNIQYIDTDSFQNTISLQILDLSHNEISTLDFVNKALFNLTHLYLSNNKIVSLYENLFKNHNQIIKLDLSMNKIIKIQQNSLPLFNLQYLNITGNNLVGTIEKNTFSPAKFLRYLDLSNFKINKIDDMALIDLPVLARLNLSMNQIEYIGSNNFYGLDNLYSLDISQNYLSKINLINTTLTNLKAVYLQNNNLTKLSNSLSNARNIIYLDLSFNNISDLNDTDFKSFSNLRVLHLAHNNIKLFNVPQINALSNISVINLSHNQISYVDLKYFKELISIDLSSNKISALNNTFFKNVDNLMSVDLSNNSIDNLPPGIFNNIKILKSLNLSSNHLNKLRYGSLQGLHKTEVLDLSRNNILDFDVNVFHECKDLIKLIIDYNRIKSVDVESLTHTLSNLRVLSLGGNPLQCKEIVRNMKSSVTRLLQVTSIDKVYHEDNVYGIKCGDVNFDTTTTKPKIDGDNVQDSSLSKIVLIWCAVLSILIISMGIAIFIYKNRKYNMSRLHLRHSLEINGSECPNDLLS